jgi:serine/threonine-protein kinase
LTLDVGPGSVLGAWTAASRIARGGMSDVWRATGPLGTVAALKVLRPGALDGHHPLDIRFRNEREALTASVHPSVVALLDHGRDDPWLALAYVPGPTLAEALAEGPLPATRVASIAAALCDAAHAVHEAGWVHRDIKPSNVLLDYRDGGSPRLIDFGVAVRARGQDLAERGGVSVGSPHCTAPETVRGAAADARTDLYALGCLAFRALAGHWPFHGPNSAATLAMQVGAPVPPLPPGVPDPLAIAVTACLHKDPARRPASAAELAVTLRATGLADAPPPRRRGWREWLTR